MSDAQPQRRATLRMLAFYLLVSVAFTWPLVAHPLDHHTSRQFDIYALAWLDHALSGRSGLHTTVSCWPLGETLGRADSFLMLLLIGILRPLGQPWLGPFLLTLLGPVASAWAAERLALSQGARRPWSVLAGLTYAFGGMASTALLEGQLYSLANPWLPLLAQSWLGATSPQGTRRHGLLSGLWWLLCLLTSAYAGLVATLLVAGGFAARFRTSSLRAVAPAAAVALPSGLAYIALFVATGASTRIDSALTGGTTPNIMAIGSAHLGSLMAWTASSDLSHHSVSPVLGATALVLALAVPLVQRELPRGTATWRLWLLLAVLGGALAMGPSLRLHADHAGIPWLLAPLEGSAWASFLHFPARALWLTSLAFGVLAAQAATFIGRHAPRAAGIFVATALIDMVFHTGAPLRSSSVPTASPSAYTAAPEDRAVLDLMPAFHGQNADLEWYWNNLSCAHQLGHKRPIATRCLGTALHAGPRSALTAWLLGELLQEERSPDAVAEELGAMGFGAVAWHPDLFVPADRIALTLALEVAFGPPLASSSDGGERLVVYGVPETPVPAADPVARYKALLRREGFAVAEESDG